MIGWFYLVIGVGFVFSLLVQMWLRATYARWSQVRNSLNLPGADVSRYLLDTNGLRDSRVVVQPGKLTDHYDPRTKTVALSEQIYREPSIASAAIAAHETGHALQDRTGYGPMRLRAVLLPVAQLGAQFGPWSAIIGGILRSAVMVQVGFLMFGVALIFQLLNLPIEFDASRRAKEQLVQMGFTSEQDREGARKVLFGAAMTYVAGAATAMGQLLLVLVFSGRSLFGRQKPTSP